MAAATHPGQLYAIYRNSMGKSDTIKTNAQKRARLPAWNLLPPEIQAAWGAVFAAAPSEGQACYETFVASVDAAEPIPATILGVTAADYPPWAGLLTINQHAWDRVASITPAPTYGVEEMVLKTRAITGGGSFEIVCPNIGVYDAVIDWGDSYDPDVITSYNQSELDHFYDDDGPTEYIIRITGSFPGINMSLSPDKDMLKEVIQLGQTGLLTLSSAFYNTGIEKFATGVCDTSQVTTGALMCYFCPNLVSIDIDPSFDTSNMIDMQNMFNYCALCDGDIRLEGIDISGINSTGGLNGFMSSTPMNTDRYDATLIAWNQQTFLPGMTVHFTLAKYTPGGAAEAARTNLINVKALDIADSGPVT